MAAPPAALPRAYEGDDLDVQRLVTDVCGVHNRPAASAPVFSPPLSSPLFPSVWMYNTRAAPGPQDNPTFVIDDLYSKGEDRYAEDCTFASALHPPLPSPPLCSSLGLPLSSGSLHSLDLLSQLPAALSSDLHMHHAASSPLLGGGKHSPYNGPSSKTRVCRYYLSRTNNHFGRTCSYVHPCKVGLKGALMALQVAVSSSATPATAAAALTSLAATGGCHHGKKCTDDHICVPYLLYADTRPHGCGDGDACKWLHVRHESDRRALLEMMREWMVASSGPSGSGVASPPRAPASPYVPTSFPEGTAPLTRPACPFWYADTQSGCKAGGDCIYEHFGQSQLPSRPLPSSAQLRFADRAWEKRRMMETAGSQSTPRLRTDTRSSGISLSTSISYLSLETMAAPSSFYQSQYHSMPNMGSAPGSSNNLADPRFAMYQPTGASASPARVYSAPLPPPGLPIPTYRR